MKNSPATELSNDDEYEAIGLGPVHTNTFSFENACNSKGLGLPSTLIRRAEASFGKRSWKWIKTKTYQYVS